MMTLTTVTNDKLIRKKNRGLPGNEYIELSSTTTFNGGEGNMLLHIL